MACAIKPVENTLGGLPLGKERKKEDKKLLMLIGEILVSIKQTGRGNEYRVYAASDNKYNVNSRKNAYGINIYKGSTDKTSVTFQARHFKMGNVDKYQFNKWHDRLFTFKSGKKRYKAGKTGSMGG